MKLSIDFWEVISLLLSFVGLMFAAGKLLLAQIEKRLNERFEALEAARREIPEILSPAWTSPLLIRAGQLP
ncbi:hypothetical protein DM464_18420, partial [Salmonella enterica subsp. enterica]